MSASMARMFSSGDSLTPCRDPLFNKAALASGGGGLICNRCVVCGLAQPAAMRMTQVLKSAKVLVE